MESHDSAALRVAFPWTPRNSAELRAAICKTPRHSAAVMWHIYRTPRLSAALWCCANAIILQDSASLRGFVVLRKCYYLQDSAALRGCSVNAIICRTPRHSAALWCSVNAIICRTPRHSAALRGCMVQQCYNLQGSAAFRGFMVPRKCYYLQDSAALLSLHARVPHGPVHTPGTFPWHVLTLGTTCCDILQICPCFLVVKRAHYQAYIIAGKPTTNFKAPGVLHT